MEFLSVDFFFHFGLILMNKEAIKKQGKISEANRSKGPGQTPHEEKQKEGIFSFKFPSDSWIWTKIAY